MRKSALDISCIFIFLIIVLVVWLVFLFVPQPKEIYNDQQEGTVDLTEFNFSDEVFFYHGFWENYPEELFTPKDFDSGAVTEQPTRLTADDYRVIQYATHRMQMKLQPNMTYALSLKSADYSMRIYINGELVDTVGNPGESKETTFPRVAERIYFFTPETDTTTIVVQAANWVHKEGAYPPSFHVGTIQNILTRHDHTLIITFLITGGLLTAFLYYLGLFMLNRTRKPVLVFSLCCLLLALMTNTLIPIFYPEYNWYVAIGCEYIVHFLTFAMLMLFLDLLFPLLYHRYVTRVYYAVTGIFIVMTLLLPTEIYTSLLIIFEGVSILAIIYTLTRLAMRLKDKKLQSLLAFVGILMVCLFGLNDILYQNDINLLGNIAGLRFTTPIAMLFFVFCYGLVISLDYAETERKMAVVQRQVAEAEARVLELSERNEASAHALPEDFKLSQRETDVLWMLLDGKTRLEISRLLSLGVGTVNTYCSRIYKKTNAASLQELFLLFGVPQKNPE